MQVLFKWVTYTVLLCCYSAKAQYLISGTVKDEQSIVQEGTRISIAGSPYTLSDAQGNFSISMPVKPEMPIKVQAVKPGYELKEIRYDEETQLDIVLKKMINPNQGKIGMLYLVNKQNQPLKNVAVLVNGIAYLSDYNGHAQLSAWANYDSEVLIPGYNITNRDYQKERQILILRLERSSIEEVLIASISDSTNYQKDFERIFAQFEYERKAIEESNVRIMTEMNYILSKLKSDSTLTGTQREELKKYLSHLEEVYNANKSTLEDVIDKKYKLIFKLKELIYQKDSLAIISQQELELAKKKQEAQQKEFYQKLQWYGIFVGVLVLLLIVALWLIRKLRAQRTVITEQNRNLDAFVYKASHEIKGPLQSLLGLCKIALMDIKDAKALEYFEHVNKSAQKQLKTINNLLFFSKVKNFKLDLQNIEVSAFINDIIDALSYKDGFQRIQIKNQLPSSLKILADEKFLESIFQNLISNAINYQDYRKQDSYLLISANETHDKVVIEFLDNGIGIHPDHVKNLFTMFYRATEKTDGSGLGLYLAKISIERLNGKIEVSSDLGKCTKFTLYFPKAKTA